MARTSLLTALPLALILAGCQSITGTYLHPDRQTTTETGESRMVTSVQKLDEASVRSFPDLPIPASHKIDLAQSVIFTSPTQTMGKLVLRGHASVDSLYRFFEDNMPQKGWSTVNAFQSAVSSLYFAKPGRFVAIVITEDGTVYINAGPE